MKSAVSTKKPNTPRNVVAMAIDNHMVFAFFVLVHSLKETAHRDFSLVIGYFGGRLDDRHIRVMEEFLTELAIEYEIRPLVPSPLFTERRHLTITTFSKFVISDAVSEPHVWLDIDTVARAGWDDIFEALHSAKPGTSLIVAEKLDSQYTKFQGFNAGVLGWTGQARKPWADALKKLPEKRFSSEQYLFNTLYANDNDTVGVRFNFLSSWHRRTDELKKASIIHYSGPLKPWHLDRQHAVAWRAINPSWQAWFDAEEALLNSLTSNSLRVALDRLAHKALTSGRLHTGKGAAAGWFLRILAVFGPLGTPLVWWISRRTRR